MRDSSSSWRTRSVSSSPSISGITTSRTTLAIVRAAVVMAQSLGITTIAEGVETLRQVDFLDALGVNELQGYLVGHAMPPEQLSVFLRDFRRPGFDAV
jgi:EAL domain-containing protein (putative c-di-GMP-specific phosphodiesterase class I)